MSNSGLIYFKATLAFLTPH